jgi:hypothetical protein
MLYLLFIPLFLICLLAYQSWYFRWQARNTVGDRYFSRTLAQRQALQRSMRRHGIVLLPWVRTLLKLIKRPDTVTGMLYEGVAAPAPTCTENSFCEAAEYRPGPEDVFVVTQMKSGTTWAQQIAYEIIMRGKGDLGDEGHRHMYAISPWIESCASVSMTNAPLLGEPQSRLIKTHLPVSLCPYDPAARYIYVARHPLKCYASCRDFFNYLLGSAAPSAAAMERWFCSDDMFWGAWPDHVADWWDKSLSHDNILFIHYEQLQAESRTEIGRIADFLGYTPSADEMEHLLIRTGFAYMQEHQHQFEMAAPNLFSVAGDGAFLKQGSKRELEDLADETRRHITSFCRQRLEERQYPLQRYYPDIAATD